MGVRKRASKRREENEKKQKVFGRDLEKLGREFEVTNPEEVEARLRSMFYGRPTG